MEGEGRGRCRSMKAAEVNVACMAVARGRSRTRAMVALLPRIRARSPASRCIANAQIMIALKWTRSTPLNSRKEEEYRARPLQQEHSEANCQHISALHGMA